jgi:hypothetical protein
VKFFEVAGFRVSNSSAFEDGLEKIAIYAAGSGVTHAARQLLNGRWTSKLGDKLDIEHQSPETLHDGPYGNVVLIMARAYTGRPPVLPLLHPPPPKIILPG